MKDEKNIVVQRDSSKAIILQDNGLRAGSLIEDAIKTLDHKQVQNIGLKAAEEAIRLQVKSHEQNLDYVAGKKHMEDHIDTFGMLHKEGRTTRQNVTSDFKTGAGKMHIESKSGATCFIATVAYEDVNHPDVIFLRYYRDNFLSKSKYGVSFIAWYWINGPKLARLIDKSIWLRKFSKLIISVVVISLKNVVALKS